MSLFSVARLSRIWSNKELIKFSYLFTGDVINVSGWKDIDKEGRKYKDYFFNANSYTISNHTLGSRGFQGKENEIIIDLTKDLESKYLKKFDVVFNHTTLEHIYDIRKAFMNLCLLSKDIVIVIVPFIQRFHGIEYGGDYWRFTPMTIKKLFEENGFSLLYLNFSHYKFSSVYIFAIGSINPLKWKKKIKYKYIFKKKGNVIGNKVFPNYPLVILLRIKLSHRIRKILTILKIKKSKKFN